ncbi:AAA family ATPase [Paludibaculum fermentans]|uniref:Response regulatory domain-containing protein n=1 Tax=Paludibaculum fermentans TaxID=1473598 RepID=A0A7S7SM80_PALFE|nr:hypothetical protein [Paludibaculum fermentans]QOY90982.1 hypothetical protein IRI77_13850 [Paludibaculum fermentans]
MFTTLLISSSPARCESLNKLAVECGKLAIARQTTGYPAIQWLGSACRQFEPDLVLLDLDDSVSALACLREIQARCPLTPVIGSGGTASQLELFRSNGIQFFVAYPPQRDALESAIVSAIRGRDHQTIANLFCFVPAKAGSGASTLALGTATVLASAPSQRVLCLEADLRSGMLGEMAGVPSRGSTQSALAFASELDPLRWHNYVSRRHGVDFLLASAEIHPKLPQWTHYYLLLRFLQTRYDCIVVDLPELVNDATEEVLRRAQAVFVVTTQEPCALQLAKRRSLEMARRGVASEKIKTIVNSWNRNDLSLEDIKQYLGTGVVANIPEDHRAIRAAMVDYKFPFPASMAAGRAIRHFAERLASGNPDHAANMEAPRWSGLRRLLAHGA